MPSTIDSLQIEIQSSSTNAAKSIDDLALALGNLKKNGSFSTAIKNLNNLRNSLRMFNNIPSNYSKLMSLTNALRSLKEVGPVGSVGNSVGKLAASLKELDNVNVDRVGPQIKKIVEAVSPLSAVKAGGLGTMVNALKNIGKVTDSLDDDKITAFAERVEALTRKLEPLSAKMTTIQAGLRGINSSARSAGNGAKQMGEDIDSATLNMSSMIHVIQTAAQAIQHLVERFSQFMGQAIEWDGIAARFGRGFGDQAQETYDWIQRLNEEMHINVQQFMQYSSVYATMLTGFGVAVKDATKMALGYTELTYDIWAGYNDIYKTFDDAAEAVKSAIAGEVEPIRRAGFTIVEATLAQTAANHGLKISLANATEAQKSYLRYLTLVDQAYSQNLVGTYAKELSTAEGLMRTFSQQMKSLSQAFGSLFLPALVAIMPYIQAFVSLLADAVRWIASLFGITIQGVDWSGYNAGVGEAVESTENLGDAIGGASSAAKELKNATIGIDELNVISPPSGGGGGGGGGALGDGFEGLDIESLWDESIFAEIGNQVDAIKEKFKAWMPVIGTIAASLGALTLTSLLTSLGKSIAETNVLNKALASIAVATIEAALVFIFADNYLESGNLLYLVGQAITTAAGGYLLFKAWGTKGAVLGMVISVVAQLAAITMSVADGTVDVSDPKLWFQTAMSTLTGASGGLLAFKKITKIGAGKGALIGAAVALSLSLASITIGGVTADGLDFIDGLTGAISTLLGGAAGAGLFTALGIATGGVGFLVGAGIMLAVNVIGAAVGSVSKNAEKSIKEDLEDRFGTISLTGENLEVYIENVTAIPRNVTIDTKVWNEAIEEYEIQTLTIPVSAALDIYDTEAGILENLDAAIESVRKRIDSQNIKISLGINVSYEDYAASIDAYVANAQEYLDQHYLTSNIAIGILGSDSSADLSGVLTDFYTTNSATLAALGLQLKEAVSSAFVDGEWIPDKLQEAIDLQNEIQEILDYISEVEFRAEMQNLQLAITGDNLTPESFEDVLSGAKTAIEERLNSLEEIKMSNLQVAVMQYDANIAEGLSEAEAQKIYDQTVADIEDAYQNGRIEITYGTVDFGLDTLHEAFSAEIEMARSQEWFNYELQLGDVLKITPEFSFDDGEGLVYGNIEAMAGRIADEMRTETFNLSASARANLEALLEAMKPTMEDYEAIASASREAGATVPRSVREGLNDFNELKALSGDIDGINYMIGQGFSTDPAFLNTLATVEGAGSQLTGAMADGLLNNLDYVTDEASGVVIGIKNAVTGEVTYITPELEANLSELGVNLGDALGDEYDYVYDSTTGVLQAIVDSTGKAAWVNEDLKAKGIEVGHDLSDGIGEGIEDRKPSLWERIKSWIAEFLAVIRGKDGIDAHSPSRKGKEIGKDLSDGIALGMSVTAIRDKIIEMWEAAQDWLDNQRLDLKDFSVNVKNEAEKWWSNVRAWWDDTVGNVTEFTTNVKDDSELWWANTNTWWDAKVGKVEEFTTNVRNQSSTWWNNTKTWWSGKVGSVKTFTTNVKNESSTWWSNTKTWWSEKVGYVESFRVNVKNEAANWWSDVQTWWNNTVGELNVKVKVPHFSVGWNYDISNMMAEVANFLFGRQAIPYIDVKWYAQGGFPANGEFFVANEAGPEMIGRIGNRNAVANNDQIVEAISEGVYSAVVSAMSAAGNGSQEINVYLDGRKVTANVEKHQRERGASLMTGGVAYGY